MRILLIITIALITISCSTDPVDQPETLIYQVQKEGDGPLIPVTIVDNKDGSGIMDAMVLFDNQSTRFDLIIDDIDGTRKNMVMTPAPGEVISIDSHNHSGTFWPDSIQFTISYTLAGQFDIVEEYAGRR